MAYLGKTTKYIFHYNAKPEIFARANELRKSMTEAEKLLWQKLRNRQLYGFKFRRQHPIDRFIADFYCHKARLVIEVDGEVHDEDDQKEYDEGRNAELEGYGLKVIRFTNEQVKNNIEKVILEIEEKLQKEP